MMQQPEEPSTISIEANDVIASYQQQLVAKCSEVAEKDGLIAKLARDVAALKTQLDEIAAMVPTAEKTAEKEKE